MHRFYLSPVDARTRPLTLAGREAHHALLVLRLRRGDEVTVLDGAGNEFHCTMDNFDRDKVQLALQQTKTIPKSYYNIPYVR